MSAPHCSFPIQSMPPHTMLMVCMLIFRVGFAIPLLMRGGIQFSKEVVLVQSALRGQQCRKLSFKGESIIMKIYSNAFNFDSYLSGGVDLRTGQYNSVIRLTTISPEGPVENSRDVMLSFSMMEDANNGYGLGWTLSTTEFNETTRQLRLINGEINVTEVLPTAGPNVRLNFLDRKLQDMVVLRPEENTLHVIYKDGVVEVLRRLRQGPLFSLVELLFENGERFVFDYTWIASGDRLFSITNAQTQRVRLIMQYNNGLLAQADVLQEQGRNCRTHFTHLNNQLVSVSVPVETNVSPTNLPVYAYQYQKINDYLGIFTLRNPMGGQDIVSYNPNGHRSHNNQYIPVVTQLRSQIGGGNPDVQHRYYYSENNFTGHPVLLVNPGQDNMYQHLNTYDYWSRVETLGIGGDVVQEKQVTFNRFHLQINELTNRTGARFETSHIYNEVAGKVLGEQPANLHLPKQVMNRYQSNSGIRDEVVSIETDDFGNELARTEQSGIRHEYSYYPIAGVVGKCPAEPHGLFQRFMRQERLLPSLAGPQSRVTEHTYTEMAGLSGGRAYVVHQSSIFENTLTNQSLYLDAISNAVLHGRLRESQTTLNNRTTKTQYTYHLSPGDDVLTETRNVIGFDNTMLTTMRSTSVVNHLLLSMRKDDAVTVNFAYDINGRVIAETISPGTKNEAIRRYAYQFVGTTTAANVVTTDSLGGQYIERYDGFGRSVSIVQISSGSERRIRSSNYDHLGQLISETVIDRIDGVEKSFITHYAYDGWGKVNKTTRADNSVVISSYDPVEKVRLQGVSGASLMRSVENQFNKARSVEQVGTNDQTIEIFSRTFDGFGRCSSETDVNGNRVDFGYDIFDRITTETITSQSGGVRIIQNAYPDHTIEPLKISIKVNQILLGSRIYDGVGRMKIQTRGSSLASTKFEYQDRSTRPSSISLPSGIVRDYQYDPQIDEITQIRIAKQVVSTFSFNNISGSLSSATNNASNRTLQRDEYGRIEVDSQQINNQIHSNTYAYSSAGRLSSVSSSWGDSERRSYDAAGRFSAAHISGGQLGTTELGVAYDGSGRINLLSAVADGKAFSSVLSYDEFGRESERRITQNGVLFQTIAQSYHRNGKIASRKISDANQVVITGESFTYDEFGRLALYSCTGPNFPVDQHRRSIRSQHFTYDHLNNITQVITALVGQMDDTATRTYGGADPTQLTQIVTTNPPQIVQLRYDANGNLESDGVRVFSFDGMGRLTKLISDGSPLSSYSYDASGRQISQSDAHANAISLHYAKEEIIGLSQGNNLVRYARHQETVLARSMSAIGTEINVSDTAASVRTVVAANNVVRHVQYSPYGMSDLDDAGSGTLLDRSRPGFNGERYDPLGRLYHLGNGLRAYSPELMIFLSPDPLSPFEDGGINSYVYCGGDPINFRDPSGLGMLPLWASWIMIGVGVLLTALTLGTGLPALAGAVLTSVSAVSTQISMAAGVISLGLSIASASVAQIDAIKGTDNSSISYALGIGSLVFGMISFGSDVTFGGRSAKNAFVRVERERRFKNSLPLFDELAPTTGRVDALKAFGKEFVFKLLPLHKGAQGRLGWGGNLGAASVGLGMSVAGMTIGTYDAVTDGVELYYSSKDGDALFEAVAGGIHDVIKSVMDFEHGFDEQSERLRNSAIFDIYDR